MFKVVFGILFFWTNNSLKVQAQIPTESIDYWIRNISPRCVINVIYFEITKDFIFESTHNIPVMFVLPKYNRIGQFRRSYNHKDLENHDFYDSALRFLKAECYFSILYYKLLNDDSDNTARNDIFLFAMVNYMAYGFPNVNHFESNFTYCLILYHGRERNDEDIRFKSLSTRKMEMNLALVYLSNSSKRGYNVYCKTPSMRFEIAAKNVRDEVHSIVDQKFIITCSSQYTFVSLNEDTIYGNYYPEHLVYEHTIVTTMFLKANVSMSFDRDNNSADDEGRPRVIVSDIELVMQTLSFFPTFDNSIRFFTCYTLPVLSFHFYVSAFEIRVWIAIISSGIVLATFLKCHIYYNLSKAVNFSTWLFYFSIFMEESYSIPSNIGKNKVYRTATILWLLVAVVYTNTYISNVISGLNAPLKGEKVGNNDLYGNSSRDLQIELEKFREHYDLMSSLQFDPSNFFDGYLDSFVEKLHHSQTVADGYRILSEPVRLAYPEDVWLHVKNPFIYKGYHIDLHHLELCRDGFFPKHSLMCRTLVNLFRPANKHYLVEHTYRDSGIPAIIPQELWKKS